VKIKNEYDAGLFGDFRLTHREDRRYGHSQKAIFREDRSKEAGEEKSTFPQHSPNSTERVNEAFQEITTRFQNFPGHNQS
jgi:hypothetical protein